MTILFQVIAVRHTIGSHAATRKTAPTNQPTPLPEYSSVVLPSFQRPAIAGQSSRSCSEVSHQLHWPFTWATGFLLYSVSYCLSGSKAYLLTDSLSKIEFR